ncbi:MAG: DUF262 domain-containing protein [Candidatus Zapsychrus exili]|nr:DUF262 domain-containing protein [Candidatus Zapsychrus exili]
MKKRTEIDDSIMSTTLKFSDDSDMEQTQVGIPKEERVLRTQAYDKSVSDIVDMIKSNDVILNPEYQRNYVWNSKKASLLVESILLNVPIPIIYVSEEEDGRWSVVDGLQRLNSLRRYFGNEFKLTGLEVLQELNGSQYYKLNPKAQRLLRNGILRIILIFKESNPEIKYDIFMRLNKSSIQLNDQELRNCLYRGEFNDLLKNLALNSNFLAMLRLKKPHKRMRDSEMILRYLAVADDYNSEHGKMKTYKGSMRTFLNTYMGEMKNASSDTIVMLKDRFENTILKVHAVFGNNAFRRIDSSGKFDSAVNRAIADFIMTTFENFEYDALVSNKQKIISALRNIIMEDTKFSESVSFGTSDTQKLEYRLSVWSKQLQSLLK